VSIASQRRPGSALAAALDPSSIAIIGASDNPNKVGGRPVAYLARFGYRGRVYPINASRTTVQGLPAWPDIAALPEVPDLGVIAVPADAAPAAVRACAARGVKVVIVMASGFGEVADPAAAAAQARMVADARHAGMRLIGPNTQGLANFGTGAVASFSTMFQERAPADGPVAIVSQSGVMSVVPYELLRARGIGIRHTHATGNDADVTLPELAEAVLHDPDVRLLLLYIESMRDAATLVHAAALARDRDVPIVAIKSGRTARGADAARSHTGALASDDRMVDAFFREHGIWRANDVHELIRTTELYLKKWRPRGRQLVIVSNSGASGVMAADTAADAGLPLATLPNATRAALARVLPDFASVTNPIDITAALLTNSRLFGDLLPILAREPAADLLLISLPVAGQGYDVDAFTRDAAQFARDTSKPVVIAAPQEAIAARFAAAGLPTFANQTDAVAALAQLAAHAERLRRPFRPRVSRVSGRLPAGTSRFLDEADSLAVLREAGLSVVPCARCATADDARLAFRQFRPAVVVKACSAEVPHKSDHGLVVLDLADEEAVVAAFDMVTSRLADFGIANGTAIVAPMIRGRRELALGGRVDPTFGPVVMISDGGRYVEALPDLTLLLAPFDLDAARDAWRSLRIAPLFDGVRGEPPLDLDALCETTVHLGDFVAAVASQLASIDLNPVLAGAAGDGVVILDALIERLSSEGARQP
jgi:acyl-CoA synthetase (NDP forming)